MAEAECLDVLYSPSKVVQVSDVAVLLLRATDRHKQLLQRLLSHGGQMTGTVEELGKEGGAYAAQRIEYVKVRGRITRNMPKVAYGVLRV